MVVVKVSLAFEPIVSLHDFRVYVRTYVCMYVNMYVCMHKRMNVCVYKYLYACMYVCIYVCMYAFYYTCNHVEYIHILYAYKMYACMYLPSDGPSSAVSFLLGLPLITLYTNPSESVTCSSDSSSFSSANEPLRKRNICMYVCMYVCMYTSMNVDPSGYICKYA